MLSLFPAPHETIHVVRQALRTGVLSCTQVVERCLANVDEWEPKVHAWVLLDREGALAQAKKLDESQAFANYARPLVGIPIGIKDIIDVEGWPTAAGFEPWKDRIAAKDAPIVARLREAGAIILGKTVTTQFASFDPPMTRNPWNLERTPGGSSSGSAAAVACGMCLGALGTQTGGSITRPASYCGVAGCKPSFGFVDVDGIVPLAPSMDHPGPIGRSVRDLGILLQVIANCDLKLHRPRSELFPKIPQLGRLLGFFDEMADGSVRQTTDRVARIFSAANVEVTELPWPAEFDGILRDHRIIMATEAAAYHESILAENRSHYAPKIRGLIEEGFRHGVTEYILCKQRQAAIRTKLLKAFAEGGPLYGKDAIMVPATTKSAPPSDSTGDPAFNSPWSFLGLPTISFPVGFARDGLPLSIQLVGCNELSLFSVALWCERVIREASSANTNS